MKLWTKFSSASKSLEVAQTAVEHTKDLEHRLRVVKSGNKNNFHNNVNNRKIMHDHETSKNTLVIKCSMKKFEFEKRKNQDFLRKKVMDEFSSITALRTKMKLRTGEKISLLDTDIKNVFTMVPAILQPEWSQDTIIVYISVEFFSVHKKEVVMNCINSGKP